MGYFWCKMGGGCQDLPPCGSTIKNEGHLLHGIKREAFTRLPQALLYQITKMVGKNPLDCIQRPHSETGRAGVLARPRVGHRGSQFSYKVCNFTYDGNDDGNWFTRLSLRPSAESGSCSVPPLIMSQEPKVLTFNNYGLTYGPSSLRYSHLSHFVAGS